MSSISNSICTADKEIEDLLEDIAKNEGFREYRIEKADGSLKGDGYVGIITSVSIIGKNKENKNRILYLVIKSASKSDAFRNEIPVASLFDREIYTYDTVFPLFRSFEIEKGLQPSYFAPKLYKVNTAHKSEAIILENLKENGYRLHERKIPMDHGHVKLVMTEYGRFHAISFGLRDQYPETFENIVGCMTDTLVKFLRERFFDTLLHRCTKALESLDPHTDQEAIKLFEKLVNGLEPFLDELQKLTDNYSVALHSDCWTNNIMFKYEDSINPTNPTKVRFLDFQVSKVGPPVLDLVYFFYACSSKETFDNLDYYMRVYYDSLCTYLRKLGSDPEKMFPYSVLQQHWKKYAKFGVILSTLAIHGLLSEKDETIDFKDIAESGENVSNAFNYEIANIDEYNDRIRHIILHFVKNNFI